MDLSKWANIKWQEWAEHYLMPIPALTYPSQTIGHVDKRPEAVRQDKTAWKNNEYIETVDAKGNVKRVKKEQWIGATETRNRPQPHGMLYKPASEYMKKITRCYNSLKPGERQAIKITYLDDRPANGEKKPKPPWTLHGIKQQTYSDRLGRANKKLEIAVDKKWRKD